jgi:hypothetical protein
MSESDSIHFRHFYWENKESQKGTRFHRITAEQPKFYVRYWFYQAHMTVHVPVSGNLKTGWTMCTQIDVQWNEERYGRNFLSRCFMWWKLYSPRPVYLLNKNVQNVCILSWTPVTSYTHFLYIYINSSIKNFSVWIEYLVFFQKHVYRPSFWELSFLSQLSVIHITQFTR